MADITVTAANCLSSTNAVIVQGTFGATITQGQAVYLNSTDNEWYLAQADGTAAEAAAVGIALCGGANGQPGLIQTRGNITIGGTVAVGAVYVVSATAGGIAPWGDINPAEYVTVLGVGISATVIQMHIQASGVVKPEA